MSMTPTRDRLAEVRERTQNARRQRAQAQQVIDSAERVGDEQAEQAGRTALAMAQQELSTAEELERILLSQMAGVSSAYSGDYSDGHTFGTFGENWMDDPQTIRQLQQLAHTTGRVGNVNVGQIMSADDYAAMIQSGAWHQPKMAAPAPRSGGEGVNPLAINSVPTLPQSARYGPWQGIVPQLKRRVRLLDLIPTSTMTSGAFFFVATESGSLDTAAETAELALKPGADENLASQMIAVQTIAHWLKIARQALDDVPGFGVELNNRLIYGVTRRIEQAVLNGDGTGSNILGILNTTGLQTVAFATGTPLTDLILNGVSLILGVEAEPDAVVCNPADYTAMLAAKTAGSGQRLDSLGAFATPGDSMWGLELITSTVIPAGQVLVGDFGHSAILYVREGVVLRTSDADQDSFLRNQLTMLAEARVGLGVWYPQAFCLVHLK
jgi:hypothetical protein